MRLIREFPAAAALFSLALCAVQLSAGPQAQAPVVGQNSGLTRSIEGTVLSSSGEAVAGARVLLKDTKTLQVRSYIAQNDGRYHFYGLSTDINYQLRAEANGMTSKTKTVSVFDSHKVVKLDLKLIKKIKRS
ncbi:MAG TPA: carboxypeptidase-like regulatory domain-containing protein [Bryobacteraceae bacterium]|jgi:hypothetical protein|nr:carboxypeptidase-like regulatory domain-containing protein [Bryobacteraceae bacterium]